MIKKRFIISQLEDIKRNSKDAIGFSKNKEYLAVELEVKKIYNVADKALDTERKKKRAGDITTIFKRRDTFQRIRIMRKDIKCLLVDINHGNKKEAENWVKLLQKNLTEITRINRNSIRKEDLGMNKMVEKIRSEI